MRASAPVLQEEPWEETMPDTSQRRSTGTLGRLDRTQMIAVGAWLLLGLGIQILGAPLATFTRFGPGPGFFLKSLSAILLILAALQGLALVKNARASGEPAGAGGQPGPRHEASAAPAMPDMDPGSIARFLLLSVVLLGYAWFLPLLGFLVATAGLCWATLVLLGRRPLRALLEAVIGAVLVRYAFTAGLGVPLPETQLPLLRFLTW
jgi:Tripartite tricarboxylate transporter TctB family